MKKALIIIFGAIAVLGVVMLLMVWFVGYQPEKKKKPKKDFGVGRNPYPAGSPQYANWERVSKRKKEEKETQIVVLKDEEDEKDQNITDEAREEQSVA